MAALSIFAGRRKRSVTASGTGLIQPDGMSDCVFEFRVNDVIEGKKDASLNGLQGCKIFLEANRKNFRENN
jgi:hypothetical protein